MAEKSTFITKIIANTTRLDQKLFVENKTPPLGRGSVSDYELSGNSGTEDYGRTIVLATAGML